MTRPLDTLDGLDRLYDLLESGEARELLIVRAGLTTAKVGKAIGVRQPVAHNYLNGQRSPTGRRAVALLELIDTALAVQDLSDSGGRGLTLEQADELSRIGLTFDQALELHSQLEGACDFLRLTPDELAAWAPQTNEPRLAASHAAAVRVLRERIRELKIALGLRSLQ